jgi:OmpA-OmpF porin, OOP family
MFQVIFGVYKKQKCGNAYMGLWGYQSMVGEFIQTKLEFHLIEGQKYYAEFYAARSRMASYTSSLGIFFTHQSEASKRIDAGEKFALKHEPYLSNPDSNFLSEGKVWHKVSGTFVAKGGEQFMLIGNSKKPGMALILRENPPKRITKKYKSPTAFYYFIDCVSLWPIDSLGNKIDIHTVPVFVSFDSLKAGEVMVLDNINFETASAKLLKTSIPSLNQLAEYLITHPEIIIEISGHTDNQGTEISNIQLSQARSQTVSEYLQSKGVIPERLISKGYGSNKPLTSNDTEENRSINRRVHIPASSDSHSSFSRTPVPVFLGQFETIKL